MNCMKTLLLALLFVFPPALHGLSLDGDALGECVVRPNAEMLKSWLSGQTIVIQKGWWLKKITKIDPSMISRLRPQGGSASIRPSRFAYSAISLWTFEYPNETRVAQVYSVMVKYEGSITLNGIGRRLDRMIITAP